MKAYVITTGGLFALLTLLHIARAVAEGPRLAKDPFFVVISSAMAALSIWAWCLLWPSSRNRDTSSTTT